MINPVKINLSSLPWMPLSAKSGLIDAPGIYFAIGPEDKVQYVGRSKSVRGRWKNHHKFDALVDAGVERVAFMACDESILCEVEALAISWHDPPLNVRKPVDALANAFLLQLGDGRAAFMGWIEEVESGRQIEIARWFELCKAVPADLTERLFFLMDSCQLEQSQHPAFRGMPPEFRMIANDDEAMDFIFAAASFPSSPANMNLVRAIQLVGFAVLKAGERLDP